MCVGGQFLSGKCTDPAPVSLANILPAPALPATPIGAVSPQRSLPQEKGDASETATPAWLGFLQFVSQVETDDPDVPAIILRLIS